VLFDGSAAERIAAAWLRPGWKLGASKAWVGSWGKVIGGKDYFLAHDSTLVSIYRPLRSIHGLSRQLDQSQGHRVSLQIESLA
jgi:hypothetical protein